MRTEEYEKYLRKNNWICVDGDKWTDKDCVFLCHINLAVAIQQNRDKKGST